MCCDAVLQCVGFPVLCDAVSVCWVPCAVLCDAVSQCVGFPVLCCVMQCHSVLGSLCCAVMQYLCWVPCAVLCCVMQCQCVGFPVLCDAVSVCWVPCAV